MAKPLETSVVFFGNGPVAAASLRNFVTDFGVASVACVVTKQRPAHHKEPAPVEAYARANNLPLYFANTSAELDALMADSGLQKTVGLVIDYGVLLRSSTIAQFQFGVINSHFSLLPEWRGADPITYALLSGQQKTGVCLMLINDGLDTGDILSQQTLAITHSDTNTSLTKKLVSLSSGLLKLYLPKYLAGELHPSPQSSAAIATYAPKITKTMGLLDFNKPSTVLERQIRAFNEWPKSSCTIGDVQLIITQASASKQQVALCSVHITPDKRLLIGCRVGSLEVIRVKPLGKTEMPAAALINGYGKRLGVTTDS